MKNKTIFVIVVLSLCLLTSCAVFQPSPLYVNGLENWRAEESNVGLNQHLFPNEQFITQFTYIDGNYHYNDDCKIFKPSVETSLVYLKYDSELYLEAKQYCLDNMNLSKNNIAEYNGYVFVENLSLPEEYECLQNGENLRYPAFFTMFGYHDSLETLVFIGFHSSATTSYGREVYDKIELAKTDFGAFLTEFYLQYYDFNE